MTAADRVGRGIVPEPGRRAAVALAKPDRTDATSTARRQRLSRLAGPDGVVAGIAIDHRDSLRVVLERLGMGELTIDDLRRQKAALAQTLAPAATAVMIDAELGSLALSDGAIPADVGLIMPLEAQGYEAQGDRRRTTLLEDFSPSDALSAGADACKILLPYRADDTEIADAQDDVVRQVVAACHAVGLPLVVEPVVHRLSTETDTRFAGTYASLVIAAVTRVRRLGVDLLKLPFPSIGGNAGDPEARSACRALAEACGETPWVLLGAGAEPETFIEQISIAGAAGASGFLAGRGIWGAALRRDPAETERAAESLARPVLERCRATAANACRPLPHGAAR